MELSTFPFAKEPLEYLAFVSVPLQTLEGPAYLFFAYDAFGDYIINLSLEADERPETVLKNLYFLLEDPYFTEQSGGRFTLVMGQFQELSNRILQLVSLGGGRLLFDGAFTDHLVYPALRHLRRKLQRNPNDCKTLHISHYNRRIALQEKTCSTRM